MIVPKCYFADEISENINPRLQWTGPAVGTVNTRIHQYNYTSKILDFPEFGEIWTNGALVCVNNIPPHHNSPSKQC